MKNGSYYDGYWKFDQKNGHGTYSWANGSMYDGLWTKGRMN